MLALIDHDPEGGFNVIDTRDGEPLAWRSELSSVNEIACQLNATYPSGVPAPAHDSLVHELIASDRQGHECIACDGRGIEPEHVDVESDPPLCERCCGSGMAVVPLHLWVAHSGNLVSHIPDAITDRPELWKPVYEEEV